MNAILFLKKKWDIVFVVILFVILNILFSKLQKPITYNDGLGWDGQYYAKITQDFLNEQHPATEIPFVYRIGIPFLVSKLNNDILNSWRYLGLIAIIITIFLLHKYLSLYFESRWLRFFLLLLFILPFHSYVRRIWHGPVSIDYYDKAFLLAGLIIMDRIRRQGWSVFQAFLLSFVTFIGVFVKDIVLILPIVALFVKSPMGFDLEKLRIRNITLPPILALMPLISGTIGIVLLKMFVKVPSQGFFIFSAINKLYNKPLPDYILGWFVAFGPILVLPIYDWRNSIRYLLNHQYLMVYLLIFSLLGWIGGSATYRLLDWNLPVVFVLIGLSIQNNLTLLRRNWFFVLLCTGAYIVSQRVFWLLPNYPGGESSLLIFLTPLTNNPKLLDVIGLGTQKVNALSLATNLILSAVLLLILNPPKVRLSDKDIFE